MTQPDTSSSSSSSSSNNNTTTTNTEPQPKKQDMGDVVNTLMLSSGSGGKWYLGAVEDKEYGVRKEGEARGEMEGGSGNVGKEI
ncbi:MAG: hypothetical protein HETSPECPRED_008571 [Heterodermia speciosa]|uniref:Uncharacterized protein n=1 Tax=Heterodermia speciosa TaxID=116794 RepID=A0A8H3FY80_9LECA|nr:MAG: hypothetical protein HETSPECPRED_008571 [Heterodermia speciosa]